MITVAWCWNSAQPRGDTPHPKTGVGGNEGISHSSSGTVYQIP